MTGRQRGGGGGGAIHKHAQITGNFFRVTYELCVLQSCSAMPGGVVV